MAKVEKWQNLKIFFIKLVSIVIAIIIIFNVLFNLLISNTKYFDTFLSLADVENRKEQADIIRNELNLLLEKDNIIKKEDKVLIYKLYKKIKLEFKDIDSGK